MTSIGGQALIEGVMMRGPSDVGIVVRKSNGELVNKVDKVDKVDNMTTKIKFFRLPFIRGMRALIESMVIGTKALMFSADLMEDGEDVSEEHKEGMSDIMIYATVAISLALSIFIFMIIPTSITSLFKNIITSSLGLNLLEGLIRVTIFLLYLYLVSKIKDIRRTFEYHGAEHKTIHCYENEEELTVENVKKYPILHPRCGTSFLFMVMIISIIVFSFFGWPNPIVRIATRILLFPVIGGIAYEINKIIGRSDSIIARVISYPGLMLQKFATTLEPDDEQIEVAIAALELVRVEDKDADKW